MKHYNEKVKSGVLPSWPCKEFLTLKEHICKELMGLQIQVAQIYIRKLAP